MKNLSAALYTEGLKTIRSKVPVFTLLGFLIPPFIGGLFMVILKDPESAASMGLISTKAQLTAGTADWGTLFNFLAQAVAVGGMIIFSVITAWVFGREFSDRTVKELLSLPTSRGTIVGAKFIIVAVWTLTLTVINYGVGIWVGKQVAIPGWSAGLFQSASVDILGAGALTILLLPFVAFMASMGRGFMPAFGWIIFMVAISQISIVMGWGNLFPWSIPALFSGAAGPRNEFLTPASYVILLIASGIGLYITFYWWRNADQTK
jgi:ABC-2 type transport system permease protein